MKYLFFSLLLIAGMAKASEQPQPAQPFLIHGTGYSYGEAYDDAQAQAEERCSPLRAEPASTIHQYPAPGRIIYCVDLQFACTQK